MTEFLPLEPLEPELADTSLTKENQLLLDLYYKLVEIHNFIGHCPSKQQYRIQKKLERFKRQEYDNPGNHNKFPGWLLSSREDLRSSEKFRMKKAKTPPRRRQKPQLPI
ncbi:MAG: hypothetical protein WB586_09885 [Chthoniobacterales bacterium]